MPNEVLEAFKVVTKEDIRSFIMNVQDQIETLPDTIKVGPNDPRTPLKHSFCNGVYCREIFIPAGMIVVGRVHKHAHHNVLLEGDVSVLTEDGAKRIQGPLHMVSSAGTKRLLFTHSDTRWMTIHANPDNNTDVPKLESDICTWTYEEYDKLPKVEQFVKQITQEE